MRQQPSLEIAASCLWLTLASCVDARPEEAARDVNPPPRMAAESTEVAPSEPSASESPREPELVPIRIPERASELTRPAPGGQSGGEGVETCEIQELPLSTAVDRGAAVRDVWSQLAQALNSGAPLRWRAKGLPVAPPPTTLVVTNVQFGETVKLGCSTLETTLRFDAQSEDDQLEGQFAGKLSGTSGVDRALTIEADMVSGIFAGSARTGLPDDAQLSLLLYWRDGEPNVTTGFLRADSTDIGAVGNANLPFWAADPALTHDIVPSEVQRTACANLSPTSVATFDSEASLRQSVAQRWLLCEGRTNQDFVGLEIDSTGHWRQLKLIQGELVAAQGFGHEGEVIRNVFASTFNLAVLDMLPERYNFYTAALSEDGQTLRLDGQPGLVVLNATLHTTDLPVREPTTVFEKGARAGEAACATQPTNLTTRPATIDAFRNLLAGRWTFCSGKLGTGYAGVRFEADGTFAYLAADGGDAESGTFMIIDTSSQNGPGAYQVELAWSQNQASMSMPMFSNTPLMLLTNGDNPILLSAM